MLAAVFWESYDQEALLDVRLCDLGLTLEDTWLEPLVQKVEDELEQRELPLRPHFWLADEWFSPEGVPGIAIPFYLAHPRLVRLERSMMLGVEGGTRRECVQLLRHELGHAMQHGYALHRRRAWQRHFGAASTPYPEHYLPRPTSRRFVVHLDGWYAQAHPVEDFAETFAVWLDPRSRWRRAYAEWPALEKLEYVDALMAELRGQRPSQRSRARPYALSSLRMTLREHYAERRVSLELIDDRFDRGLHRVFASTGEGERADAFLRRHRVDLRERVAQHTGEPAFNVNQILEELRARCRALDLRVQSDEATTKLDVALLLATHTVHTLHRRRRWYSL
ncbi:MAG: putative zinc-binding metallopeptidase [Myxococcales bacterium]|nr:putative zinc-binding metallopeptidase [Myxococcales bacterium]